MIALITSLLFILAVIYAVFFCIFKLIWVIFKKDRNFWPIVLAGVFTLLVSVGIGFGTYIVAQKLMAPVKQMIADVRANPQQIFGQRTYKDAVYPFELTVFDGMDYSDWINLSDIHLKGGIDTNVFKKGYNENKPFLMSAIVRTPADEKEPFRAFINSMHDNKNTQYRIKILSEGKTLINGMDGYEIACIFYSNRGPLDARIVAVMAPDRHLYYIGVISLGENTLGKEAVTMLHSFRFTTGNSSLPGTENTNE